LSTALPSSGYGAPSALPREPVEPARPRRLDDLFLDTVRRTPDAPAILDQGSVLSYADLAGRSERIAAGLRRRGIGRGALVGLAMERSMAACATLIGILRAGAVYVPIDNGWPQARVTAIAEDMGLAALIHDATGTTLATIPSLTVDDLEDSGPSVLTPFGAPEPDRPAGRKASPSSTGVPRSSPAPPPQPTAYARPTGFGTAPRSPSTPLSRRFGRPLRPAPSW
jgi:non-ribosomal peptide synthetase component F